MRMVVFKPRGDKINKREYTILNAFEHLLRHQFKCIFKSYKTVYVGLFDDLDSRDNEMILGQFTNYRTASPSDNAIRFLFSRWLFRDGSHAAIKDTLLHEIAHAIHSQSPTRESEKNHGKEWRAICQELGCRPRAIAA